MQLDYASAPAQLRSAKLGQAGIACTWLAVALAIVSLETNWSWAALLSFALGGAGLVVSLVAVCRAVSRTQTAWIALSINLLYWIGIFFVIVA
jgi:hypothetical protein